MKKPITQQIKEIKETLANVGALIHTSELLARLTNEENEKISQQLKEATELLNSVEL